VLIKVGLQEIPALTFAGLRYSLAFLCLLPFCLRRSKSQAAGEAQRTILQLGWRDWRLLAVLGLLYYAITAGTQFIGLAFLPATTVSLMLNFTSVLVALLGMAMLSERPSLLQWGGILLSVGGTLVYFYPVSMPAGQAAGVVVVAVGVVANALSSVLGRQVNRGRRYSPLTVTTISMGVGAAVMLGGGLAFQGLPQLSLLSLAIIAWLAVVNTAFAFKLWNHTLQVLPAMESSIINSTMLVQIALLAWLFLGESLSAQEVGGMALAALGAVAVQMRLKKAEKEPVQDPALDPAQAPAGRRPV
jgi:drug/metabolite transporter (DMT)-like permease